MPELRKEPISGRWVIISTERSKRPVDFIRKNDKPKGGVCPFCPGNEAMTPPEILAYRPAGSKPNTPGWTLRVVPNKFPALKIEGNLDRAGVGIYDRINGIGAHEVIIETPGHEDTPSLIPEERVKDVLWAFKERTLDLKKDKRFRSVLIFKNQGEAAGASLEHTHSQLIALPIIPRELGMELDGSQFFYKYRERCIFCDILRQEIEQDERVIVNTGDFVAVAPYASRFPFEAWILPREHLSAYEDITGPLAESLARLFHDLLRRMDKVLESPPYNFYLHTMPFNGGFPQTHEYFHWHFEVMPILTQVAGFEKGSGFFINPTPPEEAARFLKEAY